MHILLPLLLDGMKSTLFIPCFLFFLFFLFNLNKQLFIMDVSYDAQENYTHPNVYLCLTESLSAWRVA